MKRLRVGVLGVGNMGRNHVRIYSEDSSKYDLVGVFDANEETAQRVAKTFGTTAYCDIDELLDNVEAVSVVVPSSLHKEIALKVVEHSVHALIEKPLALNSQDSMEITRAFEEKGLKLQVGHIERFNPVITELQKIIDRNKVFFAEVHRYSPFSGSGRISDTSVVEDLMIHDIDLICNILSPMEVTDIRANGEITKSNTIDFATSMLDFGDKAHAIINASRVSQRKERTMEFHLEDSIVFADLLSKSITISKNTELEVDSMGSTYRQDSVIQNVFVPIVEPLKKELEAFYGVVVNGDAVPVDGHKATAAVKICEEIRERIANRRV